MNSDELPTPPPESRLRDQSEAQEPTPLLLRLATLFKEGAKLPMGTYAKSKWVRWSAGLVLLVLLLGVLRQGIARVRETEVGVEVNNLTGAVTLRDRVGYHLFVPYLSQFHVLDRTIQRLDLGWRGSAIGGAGRDLKLKTADGSNVSLDAVITFKLIPEQAPEMLRRSGPGLQFADTWMEPFARHVCLSTFGQLATDEMYDATKRTERASTAVKALNEKLGPHGIEVIAVIPGEFRFYKEYEQVIQEKKLADQQVEEQRAQARAVLEDQKRQLLEANKKAEVALVAFQGECENRLIEAKAEADKVKREADGQYKATLLAADAALYSAGKQAEGTKATLLAEAEGMEQMCRAMMGEGAMGMIGLEYAKRLAQIRFSATPITREPSVQQFAVQPGAAAAATETGQSSPPAVPRGGQGSGSPSPGSVGGNPKQGAPR